MARINRLEKKDLGAARDSLVEKMAEYQAYTGFQVIVVFDAHYVQGIEKNTIIIRLKSFSQKKMNLLTKELRN